MTTKMVFVLFVLVACVCLTTWAANATEDSSENRVKRGYGHGGGSGGGGGGGGGYGHGGPGAGGGARGPVYFCGYVGSKEGNNHYGYGK